jgi:hypothetical protein
MTKKKTEPVLSPRTGKPLSGVALKNHLAKVNGEPTVNPAPKGNMRNLKHGARTPQLVAPRREQHLAVLRADYPHLDERRLALMADRLARIDLATAWIEKQKSLVYDKQGNVFQVAREVEKWAARAEQVLAEAEKEGRKAHRVDLATEMSELEEGEAA